MKNDPSIRERIDKLPEWARQHIESLRRQRDDAVSVLNAFTDQQTQSEVWIEAHPCTGETSGPSFKRKYIQTREVVFNYANVLLRVMLSRPDDNQRNYGIELSFEPADRRTHYLPVIVRSGNRIELVHKDNLRPTQ